MTALSAATASAVRQTARGAWWAILLLAVLYVMSLLDRTILALLIGPIKAEFRLDDIQIGFLLGTAFGIVYSVLGLPAARFADRGNRRILIFVGVTLWCLSTIASGFANSFALLLVLRLGLAAGEAVLTPSAHSLIGDLFPPEKRSLAASIYSAAGLAGAPVAFFGGAMAIQAAESAVASGWNGGLHVWQLVLLVVGLPGLLLGFVFVLTVREPPRVADHNRDHLASGTAVLRQLAAQWKLYVGLSLGAAMPSGASYAVATWAVELLKRDFNLTAVEAGWRYGLVSLVAGVGGAILAPWLSRRLYARGRRDAVVLVSMAFQLAGMVALGLGPIQENVWLLLVLICVGMAGVLGASTNIIVSMQEVAPARMRATFVALLFMIIGLVGLGVGPIGVPLVAAWLSPTGGRLGEAIAGLSIIMIVPSLLLMAWTRRRYAEQARLGFPAVDDDLSRS